MILWVLCALFFTHMHILQAQIIPVQSPAGINGKLKVIGTRLCNQYNQPIQLRGMSTHGLQWFYDDCYANSKVAAFDALKNWGADILRISMYVQEGGYETNPAGFTSKVKSLIDIATARGMYALVDFHQLDPGDPNYNTARAKTFFTEIATACKDYPNVIYDICNEPNGESVTWAVIKQYADQVIPVIRAIDDDAVVLCGTHGWSTFGYSNGQGLTASGGYKSVVNNPLTYSNIMYTFHFYADSHRDDYLAVLDAASSELPVFVTEFGFQNFAGEGVNNRAMSERYISLMRTKKISWCNWNFSDDHRSGAVWKTGTCASNNWNDTNLKEAGLWAKEFISTPTDDFPTGDTPPTNIPPAVSITEPAAQTSYTAPASMLIRANASDTDGTVSKVDFYNGTTLLATDQTAPYSFSWTNVGAGTYTLITKATDNQGATATSTSVTVTVSNLSLEDISGPACMAVSATGVYELNTSLRTNATAYSWWYNGSIQSITPVPGAAYKVTVASGTSFSAGQICVGVSYNTAPWYKRYCLNVRVCTTRGAKDLLTEAATEQHILSNPFAEILTLQLPSALYKAELYDLRGVRQQVRLTSGKTDTWQLHTSGLASGMYYLHLYTQEGMKLLKVIKE